MKYFSQFNTQVKLANTTHDITQVILENRNSNFTYILQFPDSFTSGNVENSADNVKELFYAQHISQSMHVHESKWHMSETGNQVA